MFRRLLALLLAATTASPVSAQGVTAYFATGAADGSSSNQAISFVHLSTDPTVLALTQFSVMGPNPTAADIAYLNTGLPLNFTSASETNPFYLPLTGGSTLGAGPLPPEGLRDFPALKEGILDVTPSGPIPTLSVTLRLPDADGKGSLSYMVSDGTLSGGATVALNAGDWWVLGFGTLTDPLPVDPPTEPTPTPDVVTPATQPPTTAVTPEPTTLLLAGIGLAGAAAARRFRKRVQ